MFQLYSLLINVKKLIKQLKNKLYTQKGYIWCRAFALGNEVNSVVYIYSDRKLIKLIKTPSYVRLGSGNYRMEARYMSYIIEKDVEIKGGEILKKEFRFPGGLLECKAFEGPREVNAIVEIINMENKELVAQRVTPFTIHLEVGKYTLKAIYSQEET